MEIDLYRRILEKIGEETSYVGLFLAGEPLLHPEIVSMVDIASQKKLRPYFHTNGTLMTKDLGERLTDAGLEFISFSFDGVYPQEYERVRGAKYEDVKRRINAFLGNGKKPHTVIQVVSKKPVDEESKKVFERDFEGCDQFNYVLEHNWAGEYATKNSVVNPPSQKCLDLWKNMVISWDGTLLACCRDLGREMKMGQVEDFETLNDAWNNENFTKLREEIVRLKYTQKLCKDCDAIRDGK